MASHQRHCADCERKLGRPFPEVHTWLDAYFEGDGDLGHRAVRHHLEGVEEVRQLWGDDAAQAAILHIMLDWDGIAEEEIPKSRDEAENFMFKWLARMPHIEDTDQETTQSGGPD